MLEVFVCHVGQEFLAAVLAEIANAFNVQAAITSLQDHHASIVLQLFHTVLLAVVPTIVFLALTHITLVKSQEDAS